MAASARRNFEEALADNLNTAEALAAVFEMVREGNTAMDQGKFFDGNRETFLDTIGRWDQIFAVLEDNDQEKLRQFGLVKGEQEVSLEEVPVPNGEAKKMLVETLSDEEIERRIAEREEARRRRDFKHADHIRNDLLNSGILLEDTKAGTRWKRV